MARCWLWIVCIIAALVRNGRLRGGRKPTGDRLEKLPERIGQRVGHLAPQRLLQIVQQYLTNRENVLGIDGTILVPAGDLSQRRIEQHRILETVLDERTDRLEHVYRLIVERFVVHQRLGVGIVREIEVRNVARMFVEQPVGFGGCNVRRRINAMGNYQSKKNSGIYLQQQHISPVYVQILAN